MRTSLATLFSATLLCLVASADPISYQIGRGDVLDVQVWRERDLSGLHRVDDAGVLNHVLLGVVPAAGATCQELAAELRARLERDYLREARVVVTVTESARRRASALGAVERPGVYSLPEEARILDLLFAAGGLAAKAGRVAQLLRYEELASGEAGSPEPIAVDLHALLAEGDLAENRRVLPGDVLLVLPRGAVSGGAEPRVRVVGEVSRPGVYSLAQAATLLDAVLVAGGLTDYAAANRTRLVRGEGAERSEERVRLDDLLRGRPEASNPELRAGDLIVVPESFF